MSIGIVPIEPSHINDFHRCLDVVARERRFLSFLEAPKIDDVRAFVLDNIRHGTPQIVAMMPERGVVKWCDVSHRNRRPIYAHGGVLGVGLLPEFRGQGIGTRLMRAALAASREVGLHRVELTVREQNTSAIALYKKVGFVVEGLHRDAVCTDGIYENIVAMAILLPR